MTANEVRQKYIEFFKSAPRNHKEIPPAPLVLENDPTTLFTSSGMQPLVPYLMGESHPEGKRLVNSQPSIRLQDIEEVGDNRHTTFFEMLGNWSLGDYFKKEQLPWIFEFFTRELGLPKERLWVSVFEGNDQVPKDTESAEIWRKIGIPEDRIFYYGVEKNWWSRTGTPKQMPIGEIGGPDSEVFFEFTQVIHDPKYGKECHPNCDCGRFLEIGNTVFMQYKKVGEKKLEELPNKNVDFGGGLERITAAVNQVPDIFQIDLFEQIIRSIEKQYGVTFGRDSDVDCSLRIIADHLRASAMLISSNVLPSNKGQGYVLRRLVRRMVFHLSQLKKGYVGLPIIEDLDKHKYPLKLKNWLDISHIVDEEADKFNKTLESGLRKLKDNIRKEGKIDGRFVFDLYQTNGFPLELTLEVLKEEKIEFSEEDRKNFEEEFEKHQELSRTTSAGVFKGGLAEHSPDVIKLHTATHLLLASLRKVLGDHVVQKGQNITSARTRFDFPHSQKLSETELSKVEDMINEIIEKNLPVNFKVLPKDKALATGAIHAFNEKYADTVKVYYVGGDLENAVSKEFCGGPHVGHTSEIGRVRIKKQEKIGAGLVRIYAQLEP